MDRDDILMFLTLINKNWAKLMLIMIGEGFKIAEYVIIFFILILFIYILG